MTRTQRSLPSSRGKNLPNSSQRQSQISRTLSKLLRHQAENERIPITKDGWVNLSDLLSWRGLSDAHKFNPPVTITEIMDVVVDDGIHGKGRFGLKLADTGITTDAPGKKEVANSVQQLTVSEQDATQTLSITSKHPTSADLNSKNSPETLAVIAHQAGNPDLSASAYLIRATQGHSIKAVESEGLLTPITLDDPSTIPSTVVHGTFYGAWAGIQSTGGLMPMSRNMVHFASGPSLLEVLPPSSVNEYFVDQPEQAISLRSKQQVDDILSQNKVISGMRWDAQILIYIDLRRLLQDAKDKGWDMKWWRSDNGVILSEGVVIPVSHGAHAAIESTSAGIELGSLDEESLDRGTRGHRALLKGQMCQGSTARIVPLEYFDAVVEIKAGIGLLYRAGRGVIRELPEHLKSTGVPRNKGPRRAHVTSGGQRKPRMKVERSNDLRVELDEEHS